MRNEGWPVRPGAWGAVVALLLLVGACRGAPPPDPTATAAPPTAPATPPAPTPERRPTEPAKADPFPRATTTVAETGAVLWAPWPMEGRDLGRTNRSPIVGPRAGALLWSVEIDPPSFGQVVQAADGTLYVGTETGKLQAIDRDGVRWSFETAGPIPTPAIGPDGTVYARGGDGALYAIRPDGRRRWTTDIGAEPKRLGPAPLIGPDGYGYLTSYHQGMVYLVQPGGFFQWAVNTRARTPVAPAVGPDGTVYAGAADGTLRALDREGVERWRADLGGAITGPPALGTDGLIHVLVGDAAAELVRVSPSGQVQWRAPACWRSGSPLLWPALAADGRIQVADCAIGSHGARAWQAPVEGARATPSALDADGQAFLAAGKTVYAVGPDGALRWSLPLESEVLMPPSIGSGGVLYLSGARPDRLYAIGGR